MTKEMTITGPRRLLADYLEACIHRSFTNEADMLLQDGLVSREERIALSAAIGSALNTFRTSLSPDIVARAFPEHEHDAPMAMSYSIKNALKGIEQSLRNWINPVVEEKEFDASAWDGSAGRWSTAEAYCSDCLIDTNPSGQKKVKSNCHLPYRNPGSKAINKNALRAIGAGAHGISALKGVSPADKKKAANWVISNWKSAFGTTAPAGMYRIVGKTPPSSATKSAFQLLKSKTGDLYALLIYSNKWEDREEDIIAEAAHERYAKMVNEHGFRPQMTPFHQPSLPKEFWLKVYAKYKDDIPKLNEIVRKVYRDLTGFAFAEADRIVVMNGFSIMVGKVYPDMVDVAEKLADMPDVGSSHSFVVTDFSRRENGGMLMNDYWTFEGSPLPRSRAANPLTALSIEEKAMEQVMKLTSEDEAWMTDLLGSERFDALRDKTGALAGTLDAILAFKATTAPEEDEDTSDDEDMSNTPAAEKKDGDTETPEEEQPATPDIQAILPTLMPEVMKALNVPELQRVIGELVASKKELTDKVADLESKLETANKELTKVQKSADEQIAEQLVPLTWGLNFAQPSKSTENVVPETEVKETAPKLPAAAAKDGEFNALGVGLWDHFQ